MKEKDHHGCDIQINKIEIPADVITGKSKKRQRIKSESESECESDENNGIKIKKQKNKKRKTIKIENDSESEREQEQQNEDEYEYDSFTVPDDEVEDENEDLSEEFETDHDNSSASASTNTKRKPKSKRKLKPIETEAETETGSELESESESESENTSESTLTLTELSEIDKSTLDENLKRRIFENLKLPSKINRQCQSSSPLEFHEKEENDNKSKIDIEDKLLLSKITSELEPPQDKIKIDKNTINAIKKKSQSTFSILEEMLKHNIMNKLRPVKSIKKYTNGGDSDEDEIEKKYRYADDNDDRSSSENTHLSQWSQDLFDNWQSEREHLKNQKLSKNEQKILDEKISEISNLLDSNDVQINQLLKLKLTKKDTLELFTLYLCQAAAQPSSTERYAILTKLKDAMDRSILPDDLVLVKERIDEINLRTKGETIYRRILKLQTSDHNIAAIENKYQSIVSSGDDKDKEEVFKMKEWIEQALRIPTDTTPLIDLLRAKNKGQSENKLCIHSEIGGYLLQAKKIFDENLYGMNREKQELLLQLNDILRRPGCRPTVLGLCGPPGTGKTELMRTMGKACGLEFGQISLGGCHDVSTLEGHSSTYIGAQPGLIAKILMRMKKLNGIILLDELDKLSTTPGGREILGALLHILDPTQNSEYHDKYFDEYEFDLSKIWIVCSMNDVTLLDKILLDRLHMIHVSPQTSLDKFNIIKLFTIPKVLKNIGLEPEEIDFTDEAIKKLIQFRKEKEGDKSFGMRTLNQDVANILQRVSAIKTIHFASLSKPEIAKEIEFSFYPKKKKIEFPFVINEKIAREFSGQDLVESSHNPMFT